MILDRLEQADRYLPLHPLFEPALAWLRQPGLADLPDGRHDIDGDRLYGIVAHAARRPSESARLEAHRRYLDIQYVISGIDQIGWLPLHRAAAVSQPYDASADILFFADQAETWLAVAPGELAIFWPQDAHVPLVGQGQVHKVVLKVEV